MPIKDLHSHPLQSAFFTDCSAAEDETLAADLRVRGQLSPVDVMPANNAARLKAGTILDGHRRVHQLAGMGKTEVDVIVREDLKDADATTVEAEFLKFNFHRRQLHPLDKARVARRLFEIEKKRAPGQLRPGDKAAARDRIGKAMQMSGRNLERYVHVLDTPLPVQNAVRDGRLLLVAGAKIAMLKKEQQLEIAKQIAGITDRVEITNIVNAYISVPDGSRHESVGDAVAALARSLKKSSVDLGDRVENVSPRLAAKFLPTFEEASKMIAVLIQQAGKFENESRPWSSCPEPIDLKKWN